MTIEVDNLKDSGTGNTDAIEALISGRAKVWAYAFAGGSANASFGASSFVENGTGDYTVNFTPVFSSADYASSGIPNNSSSPIIETVSSQLTTSVNVDLWDAASSRNGSAPGIVIHGTLA